MAQPAGYRSTSTTTTSTAGGNDKPNHYTAPAIGLDCLKIVLFIIVFVMLFALTPCFWLLQPSPPQFRVNSSSFSTLNVSAYNDITANWDVTFSVINPNIHDMFFDGIKGFVLHEKESLLNTTLTPFKVGGKNQTTIETRFGSVLVHVDGCNVNNTALNGPCGAANLSVELLAKAKYEGWTWPIKRDVIKVECGSNVTTPVFGSRDCSVRGSWERIRKISSEIVIISYILVIIFGLSL